MPSASEPPQAPTDAEVLRDATVVADRDAARAGVSVQDLDDHAEIAAASRLFDAVWGRPGEAGAVLVPEALHAIVHAGGQVSGAYREGELVAATAAFLGRDEHGSFLHSHVTGVLDDVTGSGVGAALKWHQRAWCLGRGLSQVRWTFDPLIRRNVAFNLIRLGAQAARYLEDAYGRMPDARNAGLPSDRLLVRWDLASPRVSGAAQGRTASPDVDALRRSGAEVALEELPDGSPHVRFVESPRQLLRVPEDVERLRVTDPDLALAWAVAVRAVLGEALAAGGRISGATRDGWLVVVRAREQVEELAGGRR